MGTRWGAWADAAAFAVAAAALRVPFTSDWLWAWDSVLYARAIDDLSIGSGGPLDQRPHPPGYVFYVLTARFFAWVLGDANDGLVAVSMIAGVLAVVAGYAVARAMGGRLAGLVAGAVLLADPVLWHASEIAYPYVLLALLSGIVGLVLWRAQRGQTSFVVASAIFGLALGFRQDLALHLGALWLFVGVQRGPRALVSGALAVLAASLAWLVPSAIASGGIDRYLALVWAQALGASGLELDAWKAIEANVVLASTGLRWQLLWLWPLAAGGAFVLARERRDAGAFLAAWTIPSAVALAVLHTGEAGYTLALATPLAVCVALMARRTAALPRPLVARGALATVGVLIALLGGTFAVGAGRFSVQAIDRHDAILDEQTAYIRAHFSPHETALIGEANYMHAVRYLSEYRAVYHAPRHTGIRRRALASQLAGRRYAVLVDDSDLRLRHLAERVRLSGDVDLYVITLDADVLGVLSREEGPD